jgi:putrescine transport system ATP-binding protein
MEQHTEADAQIPPYLVVKGLLKRYDDVTAVDRVDLAVRRHEVFALLGSSGSGKSTLLRMLAGLELPTAGSILLDGKDITELPAYRRPINMMFQSYALFPHMSVEANVAFGLKQDKLRVDEIHHRVGEMLDLVQMGKFARRMPHQLSGGQQQRVALARSLAKHPKLLLLDEPLGALDNKIRQQTRLELLDVIGKVGVTCMLVTHDQEEAMSMASRIGVMSDGRLVQVGPPAEIYDKPNSRFTADFIGDTNIIYGTIETVADAHSTVAAPDLQSEIVLQGRIPQSPGTAVWVSVRPEQVMIGHTKPADARNLSTGRIRDVAYLGGSSIFHVELPTQRVLKAAVPSAHWRGAPPRNGEDVYVSWDPSSCVVLES